MRQSKCGSYIVKNVECLKTYSVEEWAELCKQEFRKPIVYGMWIVSEIAAMATDLAEFLGASIAINLLFGIPLLVATMITGVAT